MAITLKDIAKEANVSVSCVSLVLNNKPCRISEATKNKIRKIANKYHYQANHIARSLVLKKSNIIGLIVPDIENIFFANLCRQLEKSLLEKGYYLMIMNSDDHQSNELNQINMLLAHGIDGLLIIPSYESLTNPNLLKEKLTTIDKPCIILDRYINDFNFNQVYFDDYNGIKNATNELINLNHNKIAFIGDISKNQNSSRFKGYLDALNANNIKVNKEYLFNGDFKIKSGYEAAKLLYKTDASSVIIANDMMTLGVLNYFYENNIAIPDDFSIISYDNTINKFLSTLPLTCVEQNVYTLANTTIELLLNNINNPNSKKKEIKLDCNLIIGKTTKKQ